MRSVPFVFLLWAGIGIPVLWLVYLKRPGVGGVALIALAMVNPSYLPVVVEFGEITLRWMDIVLVITAGALILRGLWLSRIPTLRPFLRLIVPFLPFLFWTGLSLFWVEMHAPGRLPVSLASYLRLLVTFLLGGVIYLSLATQKEWKIFEKGLLFLIEGSVFIGLAMAFVGPGLLATRYGGLLGTNTYGQVSGLFILYGWLMRLYGGRGSLAWMFPFGLGFLGLIASKSATSTLATLVSLALIWGWLRRVNFPRKLVVLTIIGLGLALALTYFLRTEDVRGLLRLEGGSFAHRLMLGYAGLLIFSQNPLLGVGWQVSSAPSVIGDIDLNEHLISVFWRLPLHYFPMYAPTSVHNFYIQLLAELGLIGFLFFGYALYATAVRIAQTLAFIQGNSPYFAWSRFASWGLVYLLIWWNANPLYGGQTESILAVGFLAMLAALERLERQRQANSWASRKDL